MLDVIDFNMLSAISAAPVDSVNSATVAGSKAAMDLSFFGLFMQADMLVKSVMITPMPAPLNIRIMACSTPHTTPK